MVQTKAPVTTASPTKAKQSSPQMVFISAALSMSWQLAVVVLVPILGGFKLDKMLNLLPVLTIVGFVLAMIGMAIVVWRQLQLYGPAAASASASKGSSK